MDFNPRQCMNIAWSLIIDEMTIEDRAMRAAGHKFEDPLDDRIQYFEERIGLRVNPEEVAMALHKQRLAAMGIPWDDTQVQVDWRMQDQEFKGGQANYMGNPNDPARHERDSL
jgi:hypothetical protein